jgi:hypothetical protein
MGFRPKRGSLTKQKMSLGTVEPVDGTQDHRVASGYE